MKMLDLPRDYLGHHPDVGEERTFEEAKIEVGESAKVWKQILTQRVRNTAHERDWKITRFFLIETPGYIVVEAFYKKR